MNILLFALSVYAVTFGSSVSLRHSTGYLIFSAEDSGNRIILGKHTKSSQDTLWYLEGKRGEEIKCGTNVTFSMNGDLLRAQPEQAMLSKQKKVVSSHEGSGQDWKVECHGLWTTETKVKFWNHDFKCWLQTGTHAFRTNLGTMNEVYCGNTPSEWSTFVGVYIK